MARRNVYLLSQYASGRIQLVLSFDRGLSFIGPFSHDVFPFCGHSFPHGFSAPTVFLDQLFHDPLVHIFSFLFTQLCQQNIFLFSVVTAICVSSSEIHGSLKKFRIDLPFIVKTGYVFLHEANHAFDEPVFNDQRPIGNMIFLPLSIKEEGLLLIDKRR